jgi:hypothetical protein
VTFFRGFPVLGDLELTDDGRDFVLVGAAEKVRQNIKVRAATYKGSWRYDLNVGMPYFDEILVAGASVELVRRRFYEMLIQTPGVISVRKLTLRVDKTTTDATLYVDFAVVTDGAVITDTLDFVAAAA